MAEGKATGRPRSGLDMIVAAIAGTNDCVVVTDNERDFVGIEIVIGPHPDDPKRMTERLWRWLP